MKGRACAEGAEDVEGVSGELAGYGFGAAFVENRKRHVEYCKRNEMQRMLLEE